MSNIIENIGNNIQRFRHERGLHIDVLALECGLSGNAIRKIEAGKGNPKIKTIVQIANGLGVTVADVLGITIEDTDNNINLPILLRREIAYLQDDDFDSLCDIMRIYAEAIRRKDLGKGE